MSNKVLVIDDDSAIRDSLRLSLRELSCEVETEGDGARGALLGLEKDFDVVIVDVTLPGMNGLDICRKLRLAKPLLPILMLTSRASETDVLMGLEQGADDYLTKPFRMSELLARVRGMLRRVEIQKQHLSGSPQLAAQNIGPLSLDRDARIASISGTPLELTALEFDLLSYLADRSGRTIPRDQLMDEVWGYLSEDIDSSINTVLSRLRKKISGVGKDLITTVRGVGYRFEKWEDS